MCERMKACARVCLCMCDGTEEGAGAEAVDKIHLLEISSAFLLFLFPLSNIVHLPCLYFLILFFITFYFSLHHLVIRSRSQLVLILLSLFQITQPPFPCAFIIQMLIFLLNSFLPGSVPQCIFFKLIFNSMSRIVITVFRCFTWPTVASTELSFNRRKPWERTRLIWPGW